MDDRLFRNAMGKFATGVTVLTTQIGSEVHGMTANAFMSVSLDPKLVVISIGHNARFLPKVKESKKFAVNILADTQKKYSQAFAGQLKESFEMEFDQLADSPVIPGSLVQVSCEVVNEYVEGDHTLIIGKVLDIHLEDGEPLVFFSGQYRELKESEVKATKVTG